MAVHQTYIVIASLSKLDAGHILESQHRTVAFGTDDHVLVVCHVLIASPVFEHIAECVLRLGSKGSCRSLEVLLCEHCRYVRRHQAILAHLARVEPYTERIVTASHVYLSDSGDARESRLDVDLQVVGDEFPVE